MLMLYTGTVNGHLMLAMNLWTTGAQQLEAIGQVLAHL